MDKTPKKDDKLEVTPESVFFMNRRKLLKLLGLGVVSGVAITGAVKSDLLSFALGDDKGTSSVPQAEIKNLTFSKPPEYNGGLPLTPEDKVTTYNNFYEFGTSKADPAHYANELNTTEWSVDIGGMVSNPLTLSLKDIQTKFPLEERIYRMRCVEGWSMVIPWIGFPLAHLLQMVKPTDKAKYVAFESIYRPSELRGQRGGFISSIKYPYREGLRLDEAMNPLTLLATGVYGKTLPNQNGAPIRLVVPWKYGFKSIKSIVKITLTDTMPETTWNMYAPREYGFYANVNPQVDHPRWSQATEHFIGGNGLGRVDRQPTLMFNGYEEEVGYLYKDMDLRRFF